MKKLRNSLLIGIALIIVSLFTINLLTKSLLYTEIEIDAPAETVWTILMDFEGHPDWNPFIKSISGDPSVGATLAVTVQSSGNEPMAFTPKVLKNQANQELRWRGKLGVNGIFDGEHYFQLEPMGPNKTKFVQGENFTGILSGALYRMIGKDTEIGFNQMNKKLKEVAEQRSTS